jgi:hypothetical protein
MEMLPGNTLAQVKDGLQLLAKSGIVQYLSEAEVIGNA